MENNSSVDILHVVTEEIHDIAYIIQVNAVIIYVTVIDVRKFYATYECKYILHEAIYKIHISICTYM